MLHASLIPRKTTGPGRASPPQAPQWSEALESGKMDEYGFIMDEAEVDEFLHAGETHSAKRREGWRNMLAKWDDTPAYKRRAKIEKGIPHEFRSYAWQMLTRTQRQPGFYADLASREDNKAVYQIKLDLTRTFSSHIHFKDENGQGQTDLLHVLKAYAHYNPSIGYCQGMSYIAATLLMVMNPEDAFYTLVWVMDRMENVHDPKMSGFLRNAGILEKLIAIECPRLATHLDQNGVVPVLFCTPWFVAFFTNIKCWSTVLRIFDLFFLEGSAALMRYSLAFLKLSEAELLSCPSLEQLLTFLHNLPHWIIHPDVAAEAAGKLNISGLLHRASTFSLPPRTPMPKRARRVAPSRLPPPSPSLFTQLMTPIRRSAFLREFLPASPPPIVASVPTPAAAVNAPVKISALVPPSAQRPTRSPLSPLSPNARAPSNRAAKKRSPMSPQVPAKENQGSGGQKRRRGPASPLTPQTPPNRKAARLPQLPELIEDERENENFASPSFREVGQKRGAINLSTPIGPIGRSSAAARTAAILSPPSPAGLELAEIRTYDV